MSPKNDDEPDICDRGGKGFVLPFADSENDMNQHVRGVMYALLMIYFFQGVSIVADTFMSAIEVITSRRRQVILSSGRAITVRVWNDTVSNLTLMALGSSAPEILLAVTELLLKKEMYAGELGPATIVGSAAFNLLMIVGLCIFVIPSSETRKIEEMPVFIVTVIFMFGAYLWLVLVISVISAEEVEIWEALVTLLALPVLVWISYLADIGRLGECGKAIEIGDHEVDRVCELLGTFDRDDKLAIKMGLSASPHYLKKLENPTSSDINDLKKLVKKYLTTKKSRAAHRIEATRTFTGGKRTSRLWGLSPNLGIMTHVYGMMGFSIEDVPIAVPQGAGAPSVQFSCEFQSCSHTLKSKPVMLSRSGDVSEEIIVHLSVEACLSEQDDGTHDDIGLRSSTAFGGSVVDENGLTTMHRLDVPFAAGVRHKTVDIACPEHCKLNFLVVMRAVSSRSSSVNAVFTSSSTMHSTAMNSSTMNSSASCAPISTLNSSLQSRSMSPCSVSIGKISRTLVTLNNNSVNARLAFAYDRMLITGAEEKQVLEIMVQRLDSCLGEVACSYRTERLKAVPGFNFTEAAGKVQFTEGVTEQFVELEILPKGTTQTKDDFLLVLEEIEGDAEFNPNNDGGIESEILTIEIGPRGMVDSYTGGKIFSLMDAALNFDELRLGTMQYSEQFVSAIYCNGSPEDQAEATICDWIFHILALPWKLLFMFIPPTAYCNGWVCFWSSLLFIGALTAIIGDLAEIFGCVVGLNNLTTAITFVALGTSMPDLFASKSAATGDPTADASIVNVTGSNSVNVFLGLGLPWTFGAVYWRISDWDGEWARRYPKKADRCRGDGTMVFVVPSDGLAFSVSIFTAVAFMALLILHLRRRQIGAELGGPFLLKLSSSVAFLSLWLAYIGLSAWWSYREDHATTDEMVLVFLAAGAGTVVPCLLAIIIALSTGRVTDDASRMSNLSSRAGESSQTVKAHESIPKQRHDGTSDDSAAVSNVTYGRLKPDKSSSFMDDACNDESTEAPMVKEEPAFSSAGAVAALNGRDPVTYPAETPAEVPTTPHMPVEALNGTPNTVVLQDTEVSWKCCEPWA